jgi:hypothetical protein
MRKHVPPWLSRLINLHVFAPGIARQGVAAFVGSVNHFVHQRERRLLQIFISDVVAFSELTI